VLKQYPLSLLEGGHVGNPIFQMMGSNLHTCWDAFKTVMPPTLGPSQGWADLPQSTHAGWPTQFQGWLDLVDSLAVEESQPNLQLINTAIKIWDEERPHTLTHGARVVCVAPTLPELSDHADWLQATFICAVVCNERTDAPGKHRRFQCWELLEGQCRIWQHWLPLC
jgi:hypothetical protein